MRADIINDWIVLGGASRGGDFPPTLNKEADPWQLEPHETPDSFGIDPDKQGRIKTGSVPTGTARTAPTFTVGASTYNWYFNRLWIASNDKLNFYAPHYTDVLFRQGLGTLDAAANIVTFMPIMGNTMAVVTGSGTHTIFRADDMLGRFAFDMFRQELYASTATHVTTLDGVLYVANSTGVYSFNGDTTKELTAPIRNSLSPFGAVAITCNYGKKWIIGTSKFVIDVANDGKLFDFGTSGFRYTTRTLVSEDFRPFSVDKVAFNIEHASTAGGTLTWQTKTDDGAWTQEEVLTVPYDEGGYTRIESILERPVRNCQRFALRITALSSNIYIRRLDVLVKEYSMGSVTE